MSLYCKEYESSFLYDGNCSIACNSFLIKLKKKEEVQSTFL